MDTDLALLARIKRRDASALAELYDRYGTRVYSLALAIVGEEMTAQEVTQDTFIKLWHHPEAYRYDDNRFAAWLLMVTRHCAIDRLRHERVRGGRAVSMDEANFPEIADAAHEIEARWNDLRHVLDSLPPEQREVIVLAYYHGLSQSEIADMMKLPLGTVKTRLRLGMEKLRRTLDA